MMIPQNPLVLHKTALILSGIIPRGQNQSIASLFEKVGMGLELVTSVNIPKGSGLGTSSILAGAVIICLHTLLGRELSEQEIFNQVLTLEQMITTGGGWQDQVGGLTSGIKLIKSKPGIPQVPTYEPIVLSDSVKEQLDKQFVLVYTGQRRLAKRILRDIMGAYMLRKEQVVQSLHEIQKIALSMKSALVKGNLALVGRLMQHH